MFPFKEDLCRFDFEVDEEDEYLVDFMSSAAMKQTNKVKEHDPSAGIATPPADRE